MMCLPSLQAASFSLHLSGIANGSRLPISNTACRYATSVGKVVIGENINPELTWQHTPRATKSFALIMSDPDVPVLHSDKRRTKVHWAVVNIPASVSAIARGQASSPLTGKMVKKVRASEAAAVSFQNKTAFAASYLGPCPRQDDQKLHRYRWVLTALDVANLPPSLSTKSLQEMIKQHSLAQAMVVTTWSNNPGLCGRYCQSMIAD